MVFLKAYFTFTRKKLAVLFAILVVIVLICCEISTAENTGKNATNNSERIVFIKNSGYTLLSAEPETKAVKIPETFSDVYNNYNEIQRLAGYDLSDYKGCEVVIYTYKIETPQGYSGDCVFNMIVYNDRVIGGDVSSRILGGFMIPIKTKSE